MTPLDKLVHLVGYTATDFLDARFGEDSGPDDIARAIHAEIRTEVLNEAADELVASCPDHGSADLVDMVCRCPVADELRRKAKAGEPRG
jgi:hypothetical protein